MPKSAQRLATALRSLLRFWHLHGLTCGGLEQAVPKVANRRPGLPRPLEPGQVQALLDSRDRGAAAGLRDLTMLTLMARMGLRAGEVAALCLEDGILDGKAHGSAAHSRASRKDATFVMAPVIAVQHDTARRPTSHDDDFVLEHDRQAQSIDIEGPCFCQTRNKEDQALEVLGSHAVNPAKRGKRSPQRRH